MGLIVVLWILGGLALLGCSAAMYFLGRFQGERFAREHLEQLQTFGTRVDPFRPHVERRGVSSEELIERTNATAAEDREETEAMMERAVEMVRTISRQQGKRLSPEEVRREAENLLAQGGVTSTW